MVVSVYENIITLESLLATWRKFARGKRHKKDVADFELELSGNMCRLCRELTQKTYVHGDYSTFNISDPKPRIIHKAPVRDRLVHQLLHEALYPYFDSKFIYDSYSCRKDKGVHKALDRFDSFARRASKNHTRTCFVLKCDVKKFFANIDHIVLGRILKRHISDQDIFRLVERVISSFHSTRSGVGLPLGNLTSQLFANIYMHEFDMYVKQELRVKYYIRYADDFAIISDSRQYLEALVPEISCFLGDKLHLVLHENKVCIKTYASGVDFLGWTHFPKYRQLRNATKRKIVRNTSRYPRPETVTSYLGLLKHGNAKKLGKVVIVSYLSDRLDN